MVPLDFVPFVPLSSSQAPFRVSASAFLQLSNIIYHEYSHDCKFDSKLDVQHRLCDYALSANTAQCSNLLSFLWRKNSNKLVICDSQSQKELHVIYSFQKWEVIKVSLGKEMYGSKWRAVDSCWRRRFKITPIEVWKVWTVRWPLIYVLWILFGSSWLRNQPLLYRLYCT